MNRVILAGSEGKVGRILTGRHKATSSSSAIKAGQLIRIDVINEVAPHNSEFLQLELKDEDTIAKFLDNADTWIHAAWGREGNGTPDSHNPANLELVNNILTAALSIESRCKFILFSSVNAHVPLNWALRRLDGDLIDANEPPTPYCHNRGSRPGPRHTQYGRTKAAVEPAAAKYAKLGLDITVPRLGGVNVRNVLPSQHPGYRRIAADLERGAHLDLAWEDAVFLKHADLVGSVQQVIDRAFRPGTFDVFNLVSPSPIQAHKLTR